METGILLDLRSIEILSEFNVARLKQYIFKKYPHEDAKKRALVFADAVKRIIGSKIPECDASSKEKLKMCIIRNALKKSAFSVDCGDVLVSALELKWREAELLDSLSKWINSVLKKEIPSEQVKKLVYEVYFALDENPDLSVETVIQNIYESVEAIANDEIRENEKVSAIGDNVEISDIWESKKNEEVEISRVDERNQTDESTRTEEVDLGRETIEISRLQEIEEIRKIVQINEKRLSVIDIRCKIGGLIKLISGLFTPVRNLIKNRELLKSVGQLLKNSRDLLVHIRELLKKDDNLLKLIKELLKPVEINKLSAVLTCLICFMIFSSGLVYLQKLESGGLEKSVFNEMGKTARNEIEKTGVDEKTQSFLETKLSDGIIKKLSMRATAYDLSYESCKKDRDHPEYGITYSGRKAVLGRTVAVDPEMIPLDSELYIVFPEEYSHLDGLYVAEDIGSAVKGDIIDIFFGEDKEGENVIAQKVKEFGSQKVKVYVIN
jgi:3D (Asp-Asp-Asp) domain-containing protein